MRGPHARRPRGGGDGPGSPRVGGNRPGPRRGRGRVGWRAGVPLGMGRDAPWRRHRRHAHRRRAARGGRHGRHRRAGAPGRSGPDRRRRRGRDAAVRRRCRRGAPDGRGRSRRAATARSNGPGAAPRCCSEPRTVPSADSPPSSSCWPWPRSVSGWAPVRVCSRRSAPPPRCCSSGARTPWDALRGPRWSWARRGPPRSVPSSTARGARRRWPGSTPSCCAGPAP